MANCAVVRESFSAKNWVGRGGLDWVEGRIGGGGRWIREGERGYTPKIQSSVSLREEVKEMERWGSANIE